jgi:hypothetical protein
MWLYHICPPTMVGHEIVPLRQLKKLNKKLHDVAIAKYAEREKVAHTPIVALDCSWGDVVFLSAIHPTLLRRKLEENGVRKAPGRCFKIDPKALDPERACVLTWGDGYEEQYHAFSPGEVEFYQEIPHATLRYYREECWEGRVPLMFGYVPHIVYRGSINIEHALIVPW